LAERKQCRRTMSARVNFGLCRRRPLAPKFLTKPFRDQELLDAIQLGLSRDRDRRENGNALATLRERFASLSPRERDIMIQVARGRLSKQIAGDIGIAEATVKVHRSRAMRKMKARSLPELGRMVDKLKLLPEEPWGQRLVCFTCSPRRQSRAT
jgi:FixJ family two-component response regulator